MKTMIPNKLKFGLDLQDLPTRATQVTPEALNLSGSSDCRKISFSLQGKPRTKDQIDSQCFDRCYERWIKGKASRGETCSDGYIFRDKLIVCYCH